MLEVDLHGKDYKFLATVRIVDELPDAVIWQRRFFYIDTDTLVNNEGYTRPIYFEGTLRYASSF